MRESGGRRYIARHRALGLHLPCQRPKYRVLPRRIMVYGTTGSGKSTLARRIGERAGLPYHCMDDIAWEPDWVIVPDPIQRERVGSIVGGDAWVIDAGYSKWIDLVMPRVELIVALDYAPPLIFCRLLKRSVNRANDRQPVCNGNVETWRMMASKDSILLWFFKSFRRKRRRIRSWAAAEPDRVLVFRRPREAEAWLRASPASYRGTQV